MSRIPDKIRKALRKRAEINDFVCCEMCGKPYANNAHHRRGKGQQGLDVLSNLMLLCGSGTTGCHGLVTVNPAMAYRNGWSIEGAAAIPSQVPVRRINAFGVNELVLLYDDGQVIPDDGSVIPHHPELRSVK
jgi:hypothetical protein